jgi:hypothetical protein
MEMAKIKDAGPVLIAGIAGIAMGMAIAKKIVGGQTGGVASRSPMAKMMGMCAEMLATIKHTNALAVFATPELQRIFAEWLKQLEDKVTAMLVEGDKDTAELANSLGVSEESARYVLAQLAASGKIALSGKPVAEMDIKNASD